MHIVVLIFNDQNAFRHFVLDFWAALSGG